MGDQSANLSGMLSQIGGTVGGMGKAFDPITKAATKPRGDINDPAHLANLAQWATQHGDAAAASMYMAQSREVKADALRARTAQGQAKSASIMTQIQDAQNAEGVDPFQRKANVRALEEQLTAVTTEYQIDPRQYVGYGQKVADEALQREQRQASADATTRANGQRASIERLNGFLAKGNTDALESALVTLEEDGQATLAREYRQGMQTLADAEAARDAANKQRSEEGNHSRALTEEELTYAEKYNINPVAYPTIGAARTEINKQRVAEARAAMQSKASKTIGAGVIEDMMPAILRELEVEASSLDGWRLTPGNDGLADYINDELMGNEAVIKEISAFVAAQGPQQSEAAAANIRRLVLEDLQRRTKGTDGWLEKKFGGTESDIRSLLPPKSADDYF